MALPIAVKHKLTTPLARIYSSRADLAVKKGEMDTALSLHKKALEMQINLEMHRVRRDLTTIWDISLDASEITKEH